MHRIRNYPIVIIFLFLSSASFSQYNMDYGVNLGASNYLGEMGGDKDPRKNFVADIKLSETKFAGGGWFRYRVHPLISAKANLMYLRISGADSLSSYPPRNGRNLHFRNDIFELSTQAEFNFYNYPDVTRSGRIRIDFGAYLFAGVGVFYHNPKAFYQLGWVALQPLGTEGQGRIQVEGKNGKLKTLKKYSRVQLNIPAGFGIHYTLMRKWRLGLEFAIRKTFTDYLDDASTVYVDPSVFGADQQAKDLANRCAGAADNPGFIGCDKYVATAPRGDPTHKDFYMFTVFNAGYVMRGKSNFYREKYRFLTGVTRKKRKTRAKF